MATEQEKRQRLIEFLDNMIFAPVPKADENKYDENKKKRLADVKRSTENKKKRHFHDHYRSAVAVKQNKALEEPGLPCMYQVRDDFLKLCDQMRV